MSKQLNMAELLGIRDELFEERDMKDQIKERKAYYNNYEVLSAMHKEVRAGEPIGIVYWANMVTGGGSKWFALRYLYTIIGEEITSPEMIEYFGKQFQNYKDMGELEFVKTLVTLAEYPKKKHSIKLDDSMLVHLSYFWANKKEIMKGKLYTPQIPKEQVDKWKGITGEGKFENLFTDNEVLAGIEYAFEEKDLEQAMYFMSMINGKTITEGIIKGMEEYLKEDERLSRYWSLVTNDYLLQFFNSYMFSAVVGVIFDDGNELEKEILPVTDERAEEVYAIVKQMFVEDPLEIPKYAYDTHTRKGKAIWYPNKKTLSPGKEFILDLRFSSDWFAWMWRRNAIKQFGTVNIPWEEVEMDFEEFKDAKWKSKYSKLENWEEDKY